MPEKLEAIRQLLRDFEEVRPDEFTVADLRDVYPGKTSTAIRHKLTALVEQGKLESRKLNSRVYYRMPDE